MRSYAEERRDTVEIWMKLLGHKVPDREEAHEPLPAGVPAASRELEQSEQADLMRRIAEMSGAAATNLQNL